jgi:hypothetical protein
VKPLKIVAEAARLEERVDSTKTKLYMWETLLKGVGDWEARASLFLPSN